MGHWDDYKGTLRDYRRDPFPQTDSRGWGLGAGLEALASRSVWGVKSGLSGLRVYGWLWAGLDTKL